ncbi:MAG: hypothetical protein NTX72_01145 [Candidatus Uhrbacteria bacterium]|nr:hypothetical protein [Candidatus Uhrbacteria bacterium]
MSTLKEIWIHHRGFIIFMFGAFLFCASIVLFCTHGDKVRKAEDYCGCYDYDHAEVEWFGDGVTCIGKRTYEEDRAPLFWGGGDRRHSFKLDPKIRTSLEQAREDHRREVKDAMKRVELEHILWTPLWVIIDTKLVNCVPSRFNRDGTTAELSCMQEIDKHMDCDNFTPEFEPVSSDFGCDMYFRAKAYARAGGVKFNASTGHIVPTLEQEFREDCVILELTNKGIPLRRMCKMTTDKQEGTVTSCSVRLEDNFEVHAAYDVPCIDFDKARKAHPAKS